jgi:hypothetical protein
MARTNKPSQDAKQQRRETSRQARMEEERRLRSKRRWQSLAIYGGVIIVVLVVGALIARSALRPGPGEYFASQGRDHIPAAQRHPAYNSNPPTSGWHDPSPANWGTYRTEIPDEVLIHNLEHGGIWISYKDPSDSALVEKLEALAERYKSKVIVTPRPKNDSPIAVAAWTRLMKLDAYDERKIVDFINTYKNKGPEQVPD